MQENEFDQLASAAVSLEGPEQVAKLPAGVESVYVHRLDDNMANRLERRSSIRAVFQSGNSDITDRGVAALSRLPNLQVLDLEWSSRITDKALELLEPVRSLRYVDVTFCHQVSSGAVARFRAVRPDCEVEGSG